MRLGCEVTIYDVVERLKSRRACVPEVEGCAGGDQVVELGCESFSRQL